MSAGVTIQSISLTIPGFGLVKITPATLDLMMSRYLPASVDALRDKVIGEYQEHGMDYGAYLWDIHTVTELLFILAEFDGKGL